MKSNSFLPSVSSSPSIQSDSISSVVAVSGGLQSNNNVVVDGDVQKLYKTLSEAEKKLFRKIYRVVHDNASYKWAFTQDNGTLSYYFLVWRFLWDRKIEETEFCTLSKLWLLSNQGKRAVNTVSWKKKRHEYRDIAKHAQLGHWTLSRHNPDSIHDIPLFRPSWLLWTGSGIRYYSDLLNQFRYAVRDFHRDYITK